VKATALTLTCVALITLAVFVDITSGDRSYDLPDASMTSHFASEIMYANISEGVCSNPCSLILDISSLHQGPHHIIPRMIHLRFWLHDRNSSDLSEFVHYIHDTLSNSTVSFNRRKWTPQELSLDGWWSPAVLEIGFNTASSTEQLSCGIGLETVVINTYGPQFLHHRISAYLDVNVTYSRWWNNILIAENHQTVEMSYNLTQEASWTVESYELGYPTLP
jgi:hypothetical protein